MAHPVSPLAPKTYPELPEIAGVRFATAEAGIKYKDRTDVLLAAFDEGTTVAGVFTSPANARRRRSTGAATISRAGWRAGCWSIRAMPMPSPA